jgi:excisionase family DNA binding protein
MLVVEERYYTPAEIAERLKVTPRTVYRWLESGELRAIRFTREYRISEADVEDFISRHRTDRQDAAP